MDALIPIFVLWFIVGITLMVGYAYLGSSFVFWVAGGLVLVSIIPIPLPDLTDPRQVATWGICAFLYGLVWFVFTKPFGTNKSVARFSKEMLIGETGQVIDAPRESSGVMVKFPYPIQGSSEWPIIQLDHLEIGDQAVVVDLVGKSLVVKKSLASNMD